MTELILKLKSAIAACHLSRVTDQIVALAEPAVLMELQPAKEVDIPIGDSKIGGSPDLPISFTWPQWKGKPLGFIGQINLAQASRHDLGGILPANGQLSFFYDLEEQPWGYDPNQLGFSHIAYFPPTSELARRELPDPQLHLKCSRVIYSASLTVPVIGSQAYDSLNAQAHFSDQERRNYWELPGRLQSSYGKTRHTAHHHLLGHSHNIQGDMQLEAELVTNGLYCGDPSGYRDPRARPLELSSVQWKLLFQLDSDNTAKFMWGDCGMLYYWIREADLTYRKFDKHWMTLQCS